VCVGTLALGGRGEHQSVRREAGHVDSRLVVAQVEEEFLSLRVDSPQL
jgi:hypothetical protein